ncbi:hypothetical protein MPER_10701, partial [Moniliophthora perniciosa FA553]
LSLPHVRPPYKHTPGGQKTCTRELSHVVAPSITRFDAERTRRREDGWEDELGTEVYPDGVGPEEREYFTGPGEFEEYEVYDDYDFEDVEDLADPPYEFGDGEDEDESETDDEDTKEQFECPMCERDDKPVCSTKCGHLFCVPCIKAAYHYMGVCPICDEWGNAEELRRVFITCT